MSKTKTVGKESLSIWGGTCPANKVLDLISTWPNQTEMPYRIWEYTDHITIDSGDPEGFEWLERGRMFGEGGDLTVRRDGDTFRWWFVGKPGVEPPPTCKKDASTYFSDERADDRFNENPGNTALLWGSRSEKQQDFWEDRVAGANLNYFAFPELKNAQRVKVEYTIYTRAGRVAFVWMKQLLSVHAQKEKL